MVLMVCIWIAITSQTDRLYHLSAQYVHFKPLIFAWVGEKCVRGGEQCWCWWEERLVWVCTRPGAPSVSMPGEEEECKEPGQLVTLGCLYSCPSLQASQLGTVSCLYSYTTLQPSRGFPWLLRLSSPYRLQTSLPDTGLPLTSHLTPHTSHLTHFSLDTWQVEVIPSLRRLLTQTVLEAADSVDVAPVTSAADQ